MDQLMAGWPKIFVLVVILKAPQSLFSKLKMEIASGVIRAMIGRYHFMELIIVRCYLTSLDKDFSSISKWDIQY
jgi:hypothetical protein